MSKHNPFHLRLIFPSKASFKRLYITYTLPLNLIIHLRRPQIYPLPTARSFIAFLLGSYLTRPLYSNRCVHLTAVIARRTDDATPPLPLPRADLSIFRNFRRDLIYKRAVKTPPDGGACISGTTAQRMMSRARKQ